MTLDDAKLKSFMYCLFLSLPWLGSGDLRAETTPPNFLLILADDCTCADLELYGGLARTPRLNKLAQEGMRFTKCYQATAMCSPTRHCLYTGLYPVKSGAYPNHTMAYEHVRSIAHYLQAQGYATHLSGKTHILPKSVFPFNYSGKDNNPDPAAFAAVLKANSKSKKPFLFIAASNEPHEPWDKGDAKKYPPQDIKLPPIFVDTPETRQEYSKYLAEISYFDEQVGELLDLLDKYDQSSNTLVMVLSEQGNSFPFAKWTCYDAGLRSACVVRWPARVKAGQVSDALIEYVDVVPTLLNATGASAPQLDGISFLPVLQGKAEKHKSVTFSLQTTRGIKEGPEYFAIRSVRDTRYRYIRNLTPEVTFDNMVTHSTLFDSWRLAAMQGDPVARQLVESYQHRPAEELYDCEIDPWNQHNLIADSSLAKVHQNLHNKLDQWMKQQGDQGQLTELKAEERIPHAPKKLEHIHH